MGLKMKAFIKTPKGIAAISIIAVITLTVSLIWISGNKKETTTYRETSVQHGDLVVGITQDGSVDIGTIEQVFELDMSALQRANTGSSDSESSNTSNNPVTMGVNAMDGGMVGSMGGNMSNNLTMFDQIFGMANQNSSSGTESSSDLKVSEVCASVGQIVQEGDVLYRLKGESVEELKEYLQSNVNKAKADLDAVNAAQVLSKKTAQYTYDTSIAYGSYASTECKTSIQELNTMVETAEADLAKAEKLLAEYEAQLAQTASDYEEALQVQKNCEWSRDNTNKWDKTYDYVTYFQMAQTAKESAESLEQKKEQLESSLTQAQKNVDTCKDTLNAAKRSLAEGTLSAEETKELRGLAYSTAQETYDVAMGYLAEDAAKQEETYASAQEKWNQFSSHISDNAVCAKYNGVITSVDLEVGDTIDTDDVLVTLYNLDEVSMTVSVEEENMTDISEGTQANISFTAYPDHIFEAQVTEISDAVTDTSGNVTYDVTVTLKGDVSGLFQGMTGEITFITKEIQEVLYVSNRAVIREGTKSYVKIKDANGRIKKQEITTGFSDGVNVEIIEGLSEGEIVLIESKVNES